MTVTIEKCICPLCNASHRKRRNIPRGPAPKTVIYNGHKMRASEVKALERQESKAERQRQKDKDKQEREQAIQQAKNERLEFRTRDAQLIYTFLNEHISMTELGNRLGITRERVRQILKKNDIDERFRWVKPKPAPLTAEQKLQKRKAQFWTKINITANPDECWEWQRGLHPNGYPWLSLCGLGFRKGVRGQTVAYTLTHGKPKQWVVNICHNHLCCNPNHLRDLSPLETMKVRDGKYVDEQK